MKSMLALFWLVCFGLIFLGVVFWITDPSMRAERLISPPRDARVSITWSDGSAVLWNVTDGYADALFETIAGDLGGPDRAFSELPSGTHK